VSRRSTDPLAPAYALAAPAPPAPADAPFKRDLHGVGDIAGAAPRAYLPWATRDSVSVDDIAGTRARPRTFARAAPLDTLAVGDINRDGLFKSSRRVDPLRPAHAVHGRVVADDDPAQYTKPRTRDAGRPFLPLVTADIEGAQTHFAQEVPVGGIPPEQRRHYRVTNFLADIPGAAAGSRKPGLPGARATDPNERDYVLLEGRRLDAAELTVGRNWYAAAATVLAAEAGEAAAAMPVGRSGGLGVGPAMQFAKRVLDPRDAELAALRGTVATLRAERELLALSASLGGGGGAGARAGDAAAAPAHGAARHRGSTAIPPPAHDTPLAPSAAFTADRGEERGETAPKHAHAPRPDPVEAALAARAAVAAAAAAAAPHPQPPRIAPVHEYDPVEALRATVTAANARNVIGVLPAFPSATVGGGGLGASGALRATGRLDRNVEAGPASAVTRGENKFAGVAPSVAAMVLPLHTHHAATVARGAARELASEAAMGGDRPDPTRKHK